MFPQKKEPEKDPEFYYEVELLPKQRQALLDILRVRLKGATAANRAFFLGIETELLGCRRMNMPLIRERLPWAELEREAGRQGCTVVDLIYDLAHAPEPS